MSRFALVSHSVDKQGCRLSAFTKQIDKKYHMLEFSTSDVVELLNTTSTAEERGDLLDHGISWYMNEYSE